MSDYERLPDEDARLCRVLSGGHGCVAVYEHHYVILD